jgi:hypothetical protein
MSEWKLIDSAPMHAFKASEWYRMGERVLLADGLRCRPYFGSWAYTKKGKGRWLTDSGIAVCPMFWKEEPAMPEA